MANPIHTPPTPVSSPVEPRLDYESVPETGVRRYDEPFAAPGVVPQSRVKWSAVIAGLVIAAASQVLLGMLGVAIGLTAVDATDPNPWRALGTGMGIWFAVTSLICLFIGGYAAAKLARTFRRTDGVVHGILTWATQLLLMMMLFSSAAPTADAASRAMPGGRVSPQQLEPESRRALDGPATRGAWYALIGAGVSLLAAIAGGAAGSVRRLRDRERRA